MNHVPSILQKNYLTVNIFITHSIPAFTLVFRNNVTYAFGQYFTGVTKSLNAAW